MPLCAILVALASARATGGDSSRVWQSIGPGQILNDNYGLESGRVSDLIITGDNTTWIATAGGGLWHRGLHDSTWTPDNVGLTTLAFGSIDYRNGVLYAASGENHRCTITTDCGKGRGVFKSVDGGKTWSLLPNSPIGRSSTIRIASEDARTVWVGGDFGLWQSDDGGATWHEQKHTSLDGKTLVPFLNASAVVVLPDNHSAIAGDFTGLYRTKDSGNTWSRLSVKVVDELLQNDGNAGVVAALAIAPTDPPEILASFAVDGTNQNLGCLAGIAISRDGGDTWNRVPYSGDYFSTGSFYGEDTEPSCQGLYDNAVAIDPSHPNQFSAAGVTIISFRSAATSLNLHNRFGFHPDIHALAYDKSGNLYAADDGGVIKFLSQPTPNDQGTAADTFNAAVTVNDGLAVTQFYGPGGLAESTLVVAGAQDNGTSVTANPLTGVSTIPTQPCASPSAGRPSNGLPALAWLTVLEGDGGTTIVDPTNSKRMYASDLHNGDLAARIQSTNDGGCTWTPIGPPTENEGGVLPFVVSGNWSTIIAGGSDLYETQNGGVGSDAWHALAVWPTPGPQDDSNAYVTALWSSQDGRMVVAGRSDGYLAVLRPGNTPKLARLYGQIDGIVVDPGSQSHAMVSVQAPEKGDEYCNVEESYNFDADVPTWSSVSTGLDGDCLNTTLAWFGSYIYLATSRGVYIRDQQLRWRPLGIGLPIVPVVGLMAASPNGLVALTHGRGAWYLPLATP